MTLIRWSPLTEFAHRQKEIDRMCNCFHNDTLAEDVAKTLLPAVDIVERENDFNIRVELPGVDKKDVKITVQNDVLTIKGEKKQEDEKKSDNYYQVERCYGTFQRSFTLPTSVASDKIDASYNNGVLTVSIPKLEEAKPKEIEVKVK
ncbi:MAG: Hsp20/alpha crystallin family protein [Bacteroidota bacterium]|nr:Hsp20/alpha crystallin family protein [Bacteroidota bacterium]